MKRSIAVILFFIGVLLAATPGPPAPSPSLFADLGPRGSAVTM